MYWVRVDRPTDGLNFKIRRLFNGAVLFSVTILLLCGCQHSPNIVAPFPSRDVIALSAEDIVGVMQLAGFSESEIIELGPSLRSSLAERGGARVQVGKGTVAIFNVHNDSIYVTSRRTGNFIYRIE